jgi:hypothetical protein
MFSVKYPDPFNPVQFNSPALELTDEQLKNIKEVLDICCSDSQFSEKAYKAITHILTSSPVIPPALTSLNPSSVVLGAPSFDISVRGTGFTSTSKIIFNGFEEPTTFVSPTELTTGVNMDVWLAPAVVPIIVQNESGALSNSMSFEFLAVARMGNEPNKPKEDPRVPIGTHPNNPPPPLGPAKPGGHIPSMR